MHTMAGHSFMLTRLSKLVKWVEGLLTTLDSFWIRRLPQQHSADLDVSRVSTLQLNMLNSCFCSHRVLDMAVFRDFVNVPIGFTGGPTAELQSDIMEDIDVKVTRAS